MTEAGPALNKYTIKPLGPDTWDAFAQLAERHNGVWGGRWCTWFHPRRADQDSDVEPGGPTRSAWFGRGGRTPH